jgi:hypothetical protein
MGDLVPEVAPMRALDDSKPLPAQPAIDQAVEMWLSRKAGATHPMGSPDGGGRWYPAADEKCYCCFSIRPPSRDYPNSLRRHCCSAGHIARLFNVGEVELKIAVRLARAVAKNSRIARSAALGDKYHGDPTEKSVATSDGVDFDRPTEINELDPRIDLGLGGSLGSKE